MAIHHLTPPVRGGERLRLPSTQASGVLRPRRETLHNVQTFRSGGPVTQAIRTMRAAEPVRTETISVLSEADAAIAAIREGVMCFLAERIERDIALLDALDGGCDLEDGHDAEGLTNDNGLGEYDALGEQGLPGYGRCA